MKGFRLQGHLIGSLCVLAAVVFYGTFREGTLLHNYFSYFNVSSLTHLSIPTIITDHFPSFIQTLFFGYCVQQLLNRNPNKQILIALIAIGLASGLEVLQLTAYLPGTFDLLDLLTIFFAGLIFFVTNRQFNSSKQVCSSTFKTMMASTALISGGLISMGCYEGCDDDEYTCVEPITLTWVSLRADITPEYGNQSSLTSPGKAYTQGIYLFVIDKYRGIHIFDTTDNQNPIRKVFIPVPGVQTLSIQNNLLYVDSFTDFLTIDYEMVIDGSFDQSHVSRQQNLFMPPVYSTFMPDGYAVDGEPEDYEDYIVTRGSNGSYTLPEAGLIIGYINKAGKEVLFGEYNEEEE